MTDLTHWMTLALLLLATSMLSHITLSSHAGDDTKYARKPGPEQKLEKQKGACLSFSSKKAQLNWLKSCSNLLSSFRL